MLVSLQGAAGVGSKRLSSPTYKTLAAIVIVESCLVLATMSTITSKLVSPILTIVAGMIALLPEEE
jgi:hypothetical protein